MTVSLALGVHVYMNWAQKDALWLIKQSFPFFWGQLRPILVSQGPFWPLLCYFSLSTTHVRQNNVYLTLFDATGEYCRQIEG